MSRIEVSLSGGGECRIIHRDSAVEIRSSMAPEYGGIGGAFSSTDLLAAALGSCIATNVEPFALRYGIPLAAVRISVEKTLARSPKRIESLGVRVTIESPVAPETLDLLERAADRCLVHRSLSEDISVTVEVTAAKQGGPE